MAPGMGSLSSVEHSVFTVINQRRYIFDFVWILEGSCIYGANASDK
jgi:hypothetical protein